ncbi:MAG: WG repeat-containing protein [Cytophagaceae bacterium]
MFFYPKHLVIFLFFISSYTTAFSQLYIPYCQKGVWGFATTDGKITIPCSYQEVDFYSDDNLAKVKKGGKYGYIDKKGVVVIPMVYDSCYRTYEVYHEEYSMGIKTYPHIHINRSWSPDDANENRYIVSLNQKVGILKLVAGKPKIIIPFNYSKVQYDLNKKLFYCYTSTAKDFFTIDGQKLTQQQVEAMEEVIRYADMMSDYYNETPRLINMNGKKGVVVVGYRKSDTIIPPIYDDISIYDFGRQFFTQDGIFGVKLHQKWGLMNGNKTLLLPIQYDSINIGLSKDFRHWNLYHRTFVVQNNGKWGILGKKNDQEDSLATLLPFEYDAITKLYFSYWLVNKDGKYHIYDVENFKLINHHSYTSVTKYEHESIGAFRLFEVKNKSGQTVYVGQNGVEFFED